MRNLIVAAIVTLNLAACSDKPTVYIADQLIGGTPAGSAVTLTLNKFDDDNIKSGDGTIDIVKKPGSQAVVSEGHYQVQWQAVSQTEYVVVKVPEAHDAFALETDPLAIGALGLSKRKAFWCKDCEAGNRGGQLGFLPGHFVRKDN